MPTLLAGALRAAALITALLVGPTIAHAHGGEDHSHDTPAATVTTGQPRVAVQSDQYELFGILRGPWLDIYLDRFATNEPVPGAKIAVTIGGDEETQAESTTDGTYKVASAKFGGSGPLELIFDIKAKAGDDLLIGTLTLPDRTTAPAASATPPVAGWEARFHEAKDKVAVWVKASPALGQIPPAVVVFTFALGLCFGLLLRRGWRLVPATALALVGLLVITGVAFAHEGHDHAGEAKGAAAGDTPQRLPVAVTIFGGLVSATLRDTFLTPVLFPSLGRRRWNGSWPAVQPQADSSLRPRPSRPKPEGDPQ